MLREFQTTDSLCMYRISYRGSVWFVLTSGRLILGCSTSVLACLCKNIRTGSSICDTLILSRSRCTLWTVLFSLPSPPHLHPQLSWRWVALETSRNYNVSLSIDVNMQNSSDKNEGNCTLLIPALRRRDSKDFVAKSSTPPSSWNPIILSTATPSLQIRP